MNTPSIGTNYRVIQQLVQQLQTEKKLTDRRHAGKELLFMLTDAKVRIQQYYYNISFASVVGWGV